MVQSSSSTKLFHSLLFTTSKGMNLQQQFLVFAFCPINFHHGWDQYLPNSFYQQISHPKCMKFIKFMTWEGNPERSWNENFRLIPSRKIPGSRDFAKSRPGNPGIENPWFRWGLFISRTCWGSLTLIFAEFRLSKVCCFWSTIKPQSIFNQAINPTLFCRLPAGLGSWANVS